LPRTPETRVCARPKSKAEADLDCAALALGLNQAQDLAGSAYVVAQPRLMAAMDGHEVGDPQASAAELEGRLQDVCRPAIAAAHLMCLLRRRHAEESAFAGVEDPPQDG
jgi:hypothetical protein